MKLQRGPIGPTPSSRCAAAPLRFARYAVTAPFRCGDCASMGRAEGSRLASVASDPRSGLGLEAEHGSGRADFAASGLVCGRVGVGSGRLCAFWKSEFMIPCWVIAPYQSTISRTLGVDDGVLPSNVKAMARNALILLEVPSSKPLTKLDIT